MYLKYSTIILILETYSTRFLNPLPSGGGMQPERVPRPVPPRTLGFQPDLRLLWEPSCPNRGEGCGCYLFAFDVLGPTLIFTIAGRSES